MVATSIIMPNSSLPVDISPMPTTTPRTRKKTLTPPVLVLMGALHLTQTTCSGLRAVPHCRQNFLCSVGSAPQDGQASARFDTEFPQLVQNGLNGLIVMGTLHLTQVTCSGSRAVPQHWQNFLCPMGRTGRTPQDLQGSDMLHLNRTCF